MGTRFRILCLFLAAVGTLASCARAEKKSLELKSEADLSGLTISCSAGSYYERKFSAREDVKVFACNSEADALQAMRQGLADFFSTDEVMLPEQTMERLGVRQAFRGEEFFDVAFAIRKGNESLMEEFNSFLAGAPLDGIIAYWTKGGPAVPGPEASPAVDGAPLRLIVCVNVEPVSYIGDEGIWMGMDPDIVRRFAHFAGRPLEVSFQDLGSAIIALQAGQADIVSGCLFVTDERKQFVDFTNPYYACHPGYFVADKKASNGIDIWKRLKMNFVTENRWKLVTDGLLETIKITLLSILLGTVLGAGVCAAKRSRKKWLRSAAAAYSGFIQGTPTLVLLLIMFYVVFAGAGISASAVAVFTFALCFASTAGSIFDSAISSVPRGQTEAGLSLGFTPVQTFIGIVFPQALKTGLPLFSGECVSLLKSTSIVGYIAIQDLTRASDLIRSRTFDALVPLILVTVIYFILAWLIRKLLNLFLLKK